MFEPIHGSAPKYAGRDIVNPVAAIESVRMILEHLGENEAAADIEKAVAAVLQSGRVQTRDMGGSGTTTEMGDAIRDAIMTES